MAHFAARAAGGFAVNVHNGISLPGQIWPIVHFLAEQIVHFSVAVAPGIAKRPAGDGADVLFELRYGAGSFGPVAGVVHARGEFIDQELFAGIGFDDKQLDGDNTDVVQSFERKSGNFLGSPARRW